MAEQRVWDDGGRRAQEVHRDRAVGRLVYDLRIGAGVSRRTLAERMGTTPAVISLIEDGGGSVDRFATVTRVAVALGRRLVVDLR
jgi:transcriptional regulator with XRE-family HTH domain